MCNLKMKVTENFVNRDMKPTKEKKTQLSTSYFLLFYNKIAIQPINYVVKMFTAKIP